MPSLNNLWIPTIAAVYTLVLIFLLYAWEHLFGTVSSIIRPKASRRDDAETLKYEEDKRHGLDMPRKNKKGTAEKLKSDQDVAIDLDRSTLVPVELSWEDVGCTVLTGDAKGIKTVLQKSRGNFLPGEFVAIVGPSGAGKSTMLDVLAGRKYGKGVEGLITLNGHVMTRELSNRCISYVGQEDVFMPTATAWESLLFVSQLCMAPQPRAERAARMNAVLEQMGLTRVKYSKVGGAMPGGLLVRGLSGGEQRRLSIACGLVGNPSILFLDEPTTGLDAHSALAVMSYLHTLSEEGHTVVSTIHQPRQEIFSSFDKLLVLSEGYQLYLAPPSNVVPWFSEVLGFPHDRMTDGTDSDWLMSVVAVGFQKSKEDKARQMSTLEEVKAAAEKFASFLSQTKELPTGRAGSTSSGRTSDSMSNYQDGLKGMKSGVLSDSSFGVDKDLTPALSMQGRPGSQELPADPTAELAVQDGALYARSWSVQFAVLWKRSFLYQLRNPAIAANRLFVSGLGGIIIGLCWIRIPNDSNSAQERLSVLFFIVMMWCLQPFGWQAFATSEKRFFILDSAKGLYSPSAYFVAYVLSNLPFLALNAAAGALIMYGLVGLRHEAWAIFQMSAIMALQSILSTQLLTGCVWYFNGQDVAFSIASLYVSFSLLISGFYIRVSDMTLSVARGLSWASFNKYTFQAVARVELENRTWPSTTCVTETEPDFLQGNVLCTGSSNQLLEYYDYKLTVAQSTAAMLGFWGLFCIFSYWSLLRLCAKR